MFYEFIHQIHVAKSDDEILNSRYLLFLLV